MAVTVGAAGYSSQQPSQYDPAMQNTPNSARIWLTTGNTDTVFDATVHPSSTIITTPSGATPNGFWKVVVTQGQFVVTSSSSENAGLIYNYAIL